jgi:hypothetical protein
MSQVKLYGKYGNPRRMAAETPRGDDTPHGLTHNEIEEVHKKFEALVPKSSNSHGSVNRFFDGVLPKNADLAPNAGAGLRNSMKRQANLPGGVSMGGAGGSGGTFTSVQRPYQPEFVSDRINFPIHRILANRYMRLFYKLDPTIGTCIDYYSDLPWGNFQLTGDGVDGEVKDAFEHMCEETQLRSFLPFMLREFLVVGEAAPHMVFDDSKGIWTYLSLHNPDELEVVHAPFLNSEPYVEFVPDDRLRSVLTSDNVVMQNLRESMPPDLLSQLQSRQNIPLSPVNFTFLPRKQHFYDARGTSIISRLWRVMMYEDSIFEASIQIARRQAAPLKVIKSGDSATGWIPSPEHDRRLLEMIAQSELDAGSWIATHYGVNFELVGIQERAWKIEASSEFIEQQKLIGLGVSKGLLTGEITYAASAAGLTVFLRRLKASRDYFESKWIYPKFFRHVSEMNKWVKPTQAELSHRVRIRRSNRELAEDNRYIIPKMEWDRALDPSVDSEMINAMNSLAQLGVKFSKTTLSSMANRDFEAETKQIVSDYELEKKLYKDHPELMGVSGGEGGGGSLGDIGGGGAFGAGPPATVLPPTPEGTFEGFGGPPPGEGGAPAGPEPAAAPPRQAATSSTKAWPKSLVSDFVSMSTGYEPDEDLWIDFAKSPLGREAIRSDDREAIWAVAKDYLVDQDYTKSSIKGLETLLIKQGFIGGKKSAKSMQAQDIVEDSTDDKLFSGVG